MDKNISQHRLQTYERHVGCIIGALLVALSLAAMPKNIGMSSNRGKVSVKVVGAVREETILVSQGSTVDDVLLKARFLPQANLLEIDGNKKLLADAIIVIPHEEGITLYVDGAVKEPKVLLLTPPVTASEILKRVHPLEAADLARFKRKRVFKTGMIVTIPVKKRAQTISTGVK